MTDPVVPKSAVFGLRWPAFPDQQATRPLALAFQLERTQWWDPDDLTRMQLDQISQVLRHAHRTVPHYREMLERIGLRVDGPSLTLERFRSIPVLTRREVQALGQELRATDVPTAHGRAWEARTSGSTGRPVRLMQTDVTRDLWSALTLREHLWHRRDFTAKLAAIRWLKSDDEAMPPRGKPHATWGPPMNTIVATGESALLSLRSSVAEQKEWLLRQDPTYLLTYPTNLHALARAFEDDGAELGHLREVRTLSEALSEETRSITREVFGVPVTDMYSAIEVGFIAMQCPEHEHYHVQSETVLVEILGEDDQPCAPGEMGRVVLTSLHNYATPLIRYDVGDYAEVGEPCSCGRGLPVIRRILGRTRNMLVRPDGSTYWPMIDSKSCRPALPYNQLQLAQIAPDTLEVRVVPEEPVTDKHKTDLAAVLIRRLGYPFKIEFKIVESIPRSKSGKFEEFVSLLHEQTDAPSPGAS
jgi:phenylacetate-CoA ligase